MIIKKINDKYGHIEADEMLKQLAKILVKSTRKSDIVARFGGEEFVVLLTETCLEKAKEVTSRMRKEIHNDKFLSEHGLTVSGGLTEYTPKDTIKKMMNRADRALYDAKKSGRDRLVAIHVGEREEFYITSREKKMKKINKVTKKQILGELKNIF